MVTTNRHKLEEKSKKYIFVGYCTVSKAYRLFDPMNKNIVISRDVIFEKYSSYMDTFVHTNLMPQPNSFENVEDEVHDHSINTPMSPPSSPTPISTHGESSSATPSRTISGSSDVSSPETPPLRYRNLNDIYDSTLALFASDPVSADVALQDVSWKQAMEEEIMAIEKNETWDLVEPLAGKHPIPLKWVFKKSSMPMVISKNIKQD